jgi:hypothetical protein
MNEEGFDASFDLRPFGPNDAMQADAQFRRCRALGIALWGRTSGDLRSANWRRVIPKFLQASIEPISAACGGSRRESQRL